MREFLFLAAASYLYCASVYAEVRTALVIGNSAYRYQLVLQNPRPDAEAISVKLQALGFEVFEGYDLSRNGMVEILRSFSNAIDSSDVVLFYYAGHAIQSGGINYILPVDARLQSGLDFKTELLELEVFTSELEKASRLNIAVLDACRDSPEIRGLLFENPTRAFSIRRGLAPMYNAAPGSLIAYSTSPGQIASDGQRNHSPYTAALLRHLDEPGVDIRRMFGYVRDTVLSLTDGRQEPWVHTSLGGDSWSFAAGSYAEKTDDDERDALEYWKAIKDSANEESFRAFLSRYDDKILSPVARGRLAELTSAENGRPIALERPKSADELPDQLLQYALKELGYYKGEVDGLIGVQSRDAIRIFQEKHSWPSTGALDSDQIVTLIQSAAESGFPHSQNTMGMMAAAGIGIPVDLGLARKLFQASADQGNSYALYNLGAMYREGMGVERSLETAKELFEKAANLGNSSAEKELIEISEKGI